MSRNWQLYLEDILDCSTKIMCYTAELSRDNFFRDSKTYDAVVRNLEIIGEAARNIPNQQRSEMKNIPWFQLAAMRNILAHAYFGIDDDILWDVVKNHIPPLHETVAQFLKAEME